MNKENAATLYTASWCTGVGAWVLGAGAAVALGPAAPLAILGGQAFVGAWCVCAGSMVATAVLPSAETPENRDAPPVQQHTKETKEHKEQNRTTVNCSRVESDVAQQTNSAADDADEVNSVVSADHYDRLSVEFQDDRNEYFDALYEDNSNDTHHYNAVRHTRA